MQNQIADISNLIAQRSVYSKVVPLSGAANPLFYQREFWLQLYQNLEKRLISKTFPQFFLKFFLWNFREYQNLLDILLNRFCSFCENSNLIKKSEFFKKNEANICCHILTLYKNILKKMNRGGFVGNRMDVSPKLLNFFFGSYEHAKWASYIVVIRNLMNISFG